MPKMHFAAIWRGLWIKVVAVAKMRCLVRAPQLYR